MSNAEAVAKAIDKAVREALHADKIKREKAVKDAMKKENQDKKAKEAAQKKAKEADEKKAKKEEAEKKAKEDAENRAKKQEEVENRAAEAAKKKESDVTVDKDKKTAEEKLKKAETEKKEKEDETEKQGKRLRGRPRKVAVESSHISHHEDASEDCDLVLSDDEDSEISSHPRKRVLVDTIMESVKSYISTEMRDLKKELDALRKQQEPRDRDASAAKIIKEVLKL